MRTKKTIVHGKHSRKRSYLRSINGKSQRKGSKIQRTHTRKVGGSFKAIIKKKEENPNCEVSFEKFENSKCFQEAIYKKLNQAITEFLSETEFFDEDQDQESNFRIHYDNQTSLLFTTIKRVLMPYLVNVMEMRDNGAILSGVNWDLGYNTLIMLIILKNISSVIYDKATRGELFDLTTFENDLKKLKPGKESEVTEEVKKQKKCLDELRCLELNPNSISQILYFYFISGIDEDTEQQKIFINRLSKLIQEKKKGKKLQLQIGGGEEEVAESPEAPAPPSESPAPPASEPADAPAPPSESPAPAPPASEPPAPTPEAPTPSEPPADAPAPPASEPADAPAPLEDALPAEAAAPADALPAEAPTPSEAAAPVALPEAPPAPAPAPTPEATTPSEAAAPEALSEAAAPPAEALPEALPEAPAPEALPAAAPSRINTDLRRLMTLVTEITKDTETNNAYKTMVNTFLNSLKAFLGVTGEINGKVINENLRYFTEKENTRKKIKTDLFSICKKIFTFFNKENEILLLRDHIIHFTIEKNQLTHEEHLLCVGEIPEYMSEFDVPTQFRSKSKSIEDLGWRHSKFKKLELVVFLNNNEERTNQTGGADYSKVPGRSETGFKSREQLRNEGLIPPHNKIYAEPNPNPNNINGDIILDPELSDTIINVRPNPGITNPAYVNTSSSRQKPIFVNPAYNAQAPEYDGPSKEIVKTLDVKVFSIFQRVDDEVIGLDEYVKKGDYFVKYRLPSLILNKYQVSGKPKDSRYFGFSFEKGKRMSFNYPIRFGRTFSKFVNLMLEESMYYKSLEEGGENVENFVNKYKAYEEQRCPPYRLEITENVYNIETGSSPSKTRGPTTVNPIYGPSQTFPQVTDETLQRIPKELYELLIKVLKPKERRGEQFNEKALAQMINELISALRISKLERDTAGETDGGDNDDSGNEGNDDIINELRNYIEILKATQRDFAEKIRNLVVERKELLAHMEEIAEKLNGAEQLLAAKTAELEAKTAELEAKTAELEAKTAELEAQKEKFNELRRSFRKKLAEMNSQFETKRLEMERKIAELEQRLQEQNENLHRLQEELNDKTRLAEEGQVLANNLGSQLAQEKDENARERDKALEAITAAQREIAELKAEKEALRQQNSQLIEQKEALGASLTRLEDVERQKNLLLIENGRLNTLISGLRGELREAQAEAQAAQAAQAAQNFSNSETIRSLRVKIARLQKENTTLSKRLEEESADFNQAHQELRNELERFKTSLNEQTKSKMDSLEEQNRSLSAENEELERALEACEEQKVELQRQLTECQTQKEVGGGSAPGGGRQCVEVDISKELKQNICAVMKRLKALNPKVKTNLTDLIIIRDSATGLYKQIPYADIAKTCDTAELKFVGNKVGKNQLKTYPSAYLIFDKETGFFDLEFMRINYEEDILEQSYPENARNVPINYKDGRLVLNRSFQQLRGGTRTKKLNRVNKSRKKSKKINF